MENRQVVVFKLMGHEFGLDIKRVLEILNYEPVRPVPEVPSYVEGIINVRGTVYPIFNLRKRLGMPEEADLSMAKFVLLHLEQNKVGFLVDSVNEILTVDESQVEQKPEVRNKNQVSSIDYMINPQKG